MKTGTLLRKTALVSLMTAASRLLGLVREVLMAQFFGTSLARSAFDVAFRVPNLFRRLFGEGALSSAFVPVFSHTLAKDGPVAARQLAARVAALLAVVLATITAVGIITVTVLLDRKGLGEEAHAVLCLVRIMLPYMIFICLVALCMGALNATGHFGVPAATPVLLNVVWIGAIFVAARKSGADMQGQMAIVACGIVLAGVLQLAVQVPVLVNQGLFPRPGDLGSLLRCVRDPRIRRVLMTMAPAAVGMGIHQINVMVDGLLALWVGPWAPASLTYAERLIYLPLGVFATALGTVLLPAYSKQTACAEHAGMSRTMTDSLLGLMAIMAPATIGLMMLAAPIVEGLYQWPSGKFSDASVMYTTRALVAYGPGLIVFSIYKVLVPAFYAMGDTRTPVRVGILAVILNLGLNITFVLTWPQGYGHAGLATATVIASLFNCVLLAFLLRRRNVSPDWRRVWGGWLRVAAVCAALFAVLSFGRTPALALVERLMPAGKLADLVALALMIMMGAATVGAGLAFIARDQLKLIRRRR